MFLRNWKCRGTRSISARISKGCTPQTRWSQTRLLVQTEGFPVFHTQLNFMCTCRNFKIFILSHRETEPLSLPTAQPGPCRTPLQQQKACTIFQSCTGSRYFFLGKDQYLQSVLNHCFSSASSSASTPCCQRGVRISNQ